MTEWIGAIPDIIVMVALFALPGLVVARCLRFRWPDAVALSVPLTLAVLCVAIVISMYTGVSWGLPVLLATTVVLGGAFWAGTRFAERTSAQRRVTALSPAAGYVGVVWDRRARIIALVATLGAMVVGAFAIARGIGSPDTLNQTHDGAFHINSVMAIAERHQASPSLLANLGYDQGTGGFYPPSFAAAAALAVMYFGMSPIVATNVATVAIAILWPLTVSIAVRRIARPTSFGYAVAMVGAITVSAFPAVLVTWGSAWPNALSLLAVPPALVLTMRVLGLDRSRHGQEDPHGRLAWITSLVVLVLLVPGCLFAQPNSLFAIFFLALPLLWWALWRRFVDEDAPPQRRRMVALLIAVALVTLVVTAAALSSLVPGISSVARYRPVSVSVGLAILQFLALSSRMGFPNMAFALLILVGLVVGRKTARGRFLACAYLLVALLSILATAVRWEPATYLTGYWYNDSPRLFALIPVVGLPLAAMAADQLRVGLSRLLYRRLGVDGFRWRQQTLALGTVAAVMVGGGIVVLQAGFGTARVSQVVAASTRCRGVECVVTPGAAKVFNKLAKSLKEGERIAGNPFTGEILASQFVPGVRTIVYPTFGVPADPTAAYLALHFNRYQDDPLACTALRALDVAYIVTGRAFQTESESDHAPYAGFDIEGQETALGLTLVGSGGGNAVYRVGDCNQYQTPQGRAITAGQEAMFERLTTTAPPGRAIVGDPYTGATFAGILSHRVGINQELSAPSDLATALVGAHFDDYQQNWLVCAAVEALKIGVVVTGPEPKGRQPAARAYYQGLDVSDATPGLHELDHGGGAVAYTVDPCGE